MKFDFTVTITAILGIAAVISPIATAIINNLYQLKVNWSKIIKIRQLTMFVLYLKIIFVTLANVLIV